MKITGIVTEYNPFHNGHKYMIDEIKKTVKPDYIIAVMSGNFVQRGEPAIADKWTRAKTALLNGVDLVIELPVYFSVAPAEIFARGAIKLFCDTGIVDNICFGCEDNDIDTLKYISEKLFSESDTLSEKIKEYLNTGKSYALSRSMAFKDIYGKDISEIEKPNNILALEYLNALKYFKSDIIPIPIKRIMSSYNETRLEGEFSSARSIRENLKTKETDFLNMVIPENSINILKEGINNNIFPIYSDDFSEALNYILRLRSEDYLKNITEVTEGLHNRIKNSLDTCHSFTEISEFTKSKRYTMSKIQRILINILLDIKNEDTKNFVNNGFSQYIRVLGFRRESCEILKALTSLAKIPVITNMKNIYKDNDILNNKNLMKMLEKEILATDIYFSVLKNKNFRTTNNDFTKPLVIV